MGGGHFTGDAFHGLLKVNPARRQLPMTVRDSAELFVERFLPFSS
jgi:hypothetical protein